NVSPRRSSHVDGLALPTIELDILSRPRGRPTTMVVNMNHERRPNWCRYHRRRRSGGRRAGVGRIRTLQTLLDCLRGGIWRRAGLTLLPYQIGLQHVQPPREQYDFRLGLQVDLVIQLGPQAVLLRLAILADHHKDREKDRLQTDDHRQQAEGE